MCRAALLCALLAACSCGGHYSPAAHRVDPERARRTLEAVLDSWKAGATPGSWQQQSPSVVVQDMDWQGGAQLMEFEITTTEAIDANLHCTTILTMTDSQQRTNQRTVTYLVGTSPTLTVFRAPRL
ncbi:MAG: hypothetical protein U0992_17340 [Planctomycetaceae bacterium]